MSASKGYSPRVTKTSKNLKIIIENWLTSEGPVGVREKGHRKMWEEERGDIAIKHTIKRYLLRKLLSMGRWLVSTEMELSSKLVINSTVKLPVILDRVYIKLFISWSHEYIHKAATFIKFKIRKY